MNFSAKRPTAYISHIHEVSTGNCWTIPCYIDTKQEIRCVDCNELVPDIYKVQALLLCE